MGLHGEMGLHGATTALGAFVSPAALFSLGDCPPSTAKALLRKTNIAQHTPIWVYSTEMRVNAAWLAA